MKSIELRAALIAANDINLNGADALVESSILKQLIASCEDRVKELDPEAKKLARKELKKLKARSGKFEHLGHHYTMDVEDVYNILTDLDKYDTTDAKSYRSKAARQKALKDKSATLTKEMKAIYDNYPVNHPEIEPDSEKTTLKFLD